MAKKTAEERELVRVLSSLKEEAKLILTLEKEKKRVQDLREITELDADFQPYAEYLNIIKNNIEKHMEKRVEVLKLIDRLKDPLLQNLFIHRYINGLSWEEVGREINYEWSQVHRFHRRGLNELLENPSNKE